MRKFTPLILIALVALFPLPGKSADDTAAFPKFSSTNENQVNAGTKDIGSGKQAYKIVLVDGSGTVVAVGDATNGLKVQGSLTAVPGANASTTAAALTQGTKVVTTAGTPVLLVASTTKVESVEIFARKNPTTANTGNIYVGFSSTGGQNLRVLQPGESFSISAPAGKKIDLNLIYIDAATSADAVVYTAVN